MLNYHGSKILGQPMPEKAYEELLGRALYILLKTKPMPGYEYQDGRITKNHKVTTRPEHIWSGTWSRMGFQAQKEAKAYWAAKGALRDRERRMSGSDVHLRIEDYDAYDRAVNETRQSLLVKPAPAMAFVSAAPAMSSIEGEGRPFQYSSHEENEKPFGFVSEHYFALIHKAIPIQEAEGHRRRKKPLTLNSKSWTSEVLSTGVACKKKTMSWLMHCKKELSITLAIL